MSLTSVLRSPGFRARFAQEFEKPKLSLHSIALAPSICANPTLVGTAYDYLLRFHLQRRYDFVRSSIWIAEQALRRVHSLDHKVIAYRMFASAISDYQSFMITGKHDSSLLRSVLKLAQLDFVYRSQDIDDNFGKISQSDVRDLKNLLKVTDLRLFKPKRYAVVNPTFGDASRLVGGADADLLIDHRLIEIKTTKDATVSRDTFNQLIGYYILASIGGVDQLWHKVRITELGVYFSRYGQIVSFKTKDLMPKAKMAKFIRWFKRSFVRSDLF